jgi:hypothetical protein
MARLVDITRGVDDGDDDKMIDGELEWMDGE